MTGAQLDQKLLISLACLVLPLLNCSGIERRVAEFSLRSSLFSAQVFVLILQTLVLLFSQLNQLRLVLPPRVFPLW